MARPRPTSSARSTCPSCADDLLWDAGADHHPSRVVCDRCGRCWDRHTDPWTEVDTIACEGCPQRFVCQSRPTRVVTERARRLRLDDGATILIRLLVAGDRDELAREYDRLSAFSRRRRFFSPPKRLSDSLLDYLTNLDYHDRFALIAYATDEPTPRGVGVARWVRDATSPTQADAAVTVVDEWQHRGVGTRLLAALIDEAAAAGIETFTADVLWENEGALGPLRSLGARVRPQEAGVARVEFDLPASGDELAGTAMHHLVSAIAATPPLDD